MRYAIYYTPPADHVLTGRAAAWLGRNAFDASASFDDHAHASLVTSPRRYGFHGTLKAPFHLAASVTEADLIEAFDLFCAAPRALPELRLHVGTLGQFIALVPADDDLEALSVLAQSCVTQFEPFRAPLTEADIARRNPERLTEIQRAYLHRYGYPYVLEAFRFHMTLTNAIEHDARRAEVLQTLTMRFGTALNHPHCFATLAIFQQREPDSPFHVLRLGALTSDINIDNPTEPV